MKEFIIAMSALFLGSLALRYTDKNQSKHNDNNEEEDMKKKKFNNKQNQNYCSTTNLPNANDNVTVKSNQNETDESRPSSIAFIYQSEMDYISRCIHDYPNIETGGQLFGFITENGSPVVCYAIGPGRNANHQATFFNQDTDYLQAVYCELNRRYGLRYIGEWHSHHQLGLAKPSGHDASTIVHGIQRSNFRHFLLCIGNCDNNFHSTLNAFTFHINDPYHYNHAPWKIIKMQSPYRPIIDRDLNDLICHPIYQHASYGSNYILSDSGEPAMVTPNYNDDYWLNVKSNNLVLKSIIDYLSSYKGGNFHVIPQLDSEKHVHLIIKIAEASIHIEFGERFPIEAPLISGLAFNKDAVWTYTNDIYESFTKYFDDMVSPQNERSVSDSDRGQQIEVDFPSNSISETQSKN